DRWLALGIHELVSEMDREVYPDGADFEASTNYHRLVAETFLSCAALAERLPPERISRLHHVGAVHVPNGPSLRSLIERGIGSMDSSTVLPASFYSRLSRMLRFTATLTKPNGLV